MSLETQLPDANPSKTEPTESVSSQLSVTTQAQSPILRRSHRMILIARKALFMLIVFTAGLGSGYLVGKRSGNVEPSTATSQTEKNIPAMIQQVNPPEGYEIPAIFGDIGPKMVAVGAIDTAQFVQIYKQAGQPLTDEQMVILTQGSNSNLAINRSNAYFLLNFFWALGLTNQNPVLTDGPMMKNGKEQIGNFASIGGWTIGAKPPTELYASALLVSLTNEQQNRLMEVASSVYRPCCNNPTHFPDCNHGMAMLGLLELMASQNATVDEMFAAAKYVNAFWYPQQTLEVATVFKTTQNVDFAQADARQVVSQKYSSGLGFQTVHQWLISNGLLEQAPNSGGSCGVQ
jgi:hypothetical protein